MRLVVVVGTARCAVRNGEERSLSYYCSVRFVLLRTPPRGIPTTFGSDLKIAPPLLLAGRPRQESLHDETLRSRGEACAITN